MPKKITTKNPYNQNKLNEYDFHNEKQVESILSLSENVFYDWRTKPIKDRAKLLENLIIILKDNIDDYANLITAEMGKPISQSKSEIEKCIWLCNFYKENAQRFLSDEMIDTEAEESFISYDPLGTILAIMPWNYPFWQVMRFAVPTLTAGNTALLKHALNVTGCALIIEDAFEKAGYPKGCFQTILINHDVIEDVIADERVKAVSLTGSEKAGKSVAKIAGKHLKKCVLELGGNNACVVLEDADLNKYLDVIINARMQNTGQSCIAAKRFIVEESIYEEFLEKFTSKIKALKEGDPNDKDTDITILARTYLAETLKNQVSDSIAKGANIHYGNSQKNAYYQPTVITEVKPGMPVFDEETFGPVAAITKVSDKGEAFKLLANSRFGLGTMIFTENKKYIKERIFEIPDGALFVNEMVKSDPRLPFGGTKASGYGRELSKEGILEFVNAKTVYLK
ncbi:MAG: NAD-dependent succinate-semialdehyde dehydrogenase [Bacteroidota bacterium]